MDHVAAANAGIIPALTRRQLAVLRLVAVGRKVPSIAEELGVSPYTVLSHIRHIRMKLGAGSKLKAVAAAMISAFSM